MNIPQLMLVGVALYVLSTLNQTTLAILAGAAIVAGAIIYKEKA